jgi:hypothetical protein
MKSHSKIIGLLALLTAFASVGCKNKVPTGSGSYPANPIDYTTVVNFDGPLQPDFGTVNPMLLDVGPKPGTTSILNGGLQNAVDWVVSYSIPVLGVPPAGDSSHGALHDIFSLSDPGDGVTYPSNQIRVRLTATGYYDLTNFSGVKFMMLTEPGDDALKRRFMVAVGATLPPSDDSSGYSNNTKRNNFGVAMSSTKGSWSQTSVAFTSMTQESGYAAVSPPDFASHMKEVIWLQWSEGRNNVAGLCHVDYWLDTVEFY